MEKKYNLAGEVSSESDKRREEGFFRIKENEKVPLREPFDS